MTSPSDEPIDQPDEPNQPTPAQMRQALGHFATGVTVVTGFSAEGEPVGFACQSFASVSLAPPLVLFCADHAGRSWPLMRATGRFTVNVLHHEQLELVERFGSPAGRRFEGLDWFRSQHGGPSLTDALMRIHCSVERVHVAGDHDVVIGRVRDLADSGRGRPMLYYRGQFTVTERPHADGRTDPQALADYWG